MARSELKVGDWVQLTHSYCGCRIGQISMVPGDEGGCYRLTLDATGDKRYSQGSREPMTEGALCVRSDIHGRAKGPPAHGYFPMRKTLPYGRYICAGGSYVLHNRDYEPIMRVNADGSRTPCEPFEWVEHEHSEHFYNDLIPPWQDKLIFQRVVAILEGDEEPRPYNDADMAATRARIRRQNSDDEKNIDPFSGHAWRGVPYLWARKLRTTMSLSWGDGSVYHYQQFAAVIERSGMDAELMEVWKRHAPQCDRRAVFSHGGVNGGMWYAPMACGVEARAIVRKHFIMAMDEVKVAARKEYA